MNKLTWILPMLVASTCCEAAESSAATRTTSLAQPVPQGRPGVPYRHLRPDDRLSDLLGHPAFQGFSRRMLPRDDDAYDAAMPLAEIGQLLPFHSHVEPAVVVAALNRVVDDVGEGRTVFLDRGAQADS